jgi:hypothetical protein
MSEYTEQAEEFMRKHELTFRVVHIGSDCPTFCEDRVKGIAMDKLDEFPRKSHIHGHHYLCTISGKERSAFQIDFWNSYADEFHNWALKHRIAAMPWATTISSMSYKLQDMIKAELKKGKQRSEPTPYDVLACITKSEPGSFEEFCGEFGYDTDSRKAEQVYFAVQAEWSKVRRFFTAEEIAEIQEIS